MAFEMKGFTPFTKKDKLSKKQAEEKARRTGGEDNEPYGPEQSHHVVAGEPTRKGSLSQSEQRIIQRSIQKHGHFGDIDPRLLKGYQRGTPEHRKRVSEIKAHHFYLSHVRPENKEAMQARLHQKLSAQNDPNRITNYTGDYNTYDADGNPRRSIYNETAAEKAERVAQRKENLGY